MRTFTSNPLLIFSCLIKIPFAKFIHVHSLVGPFCTTGFNPPINPVMGWTTPSLIEEAAFSSWNQPPTPGPWSPNPLPYPLYSEISHGSRKSRRHILRSALSHSCSTVHDAQPRCLLPGLHHGRVGALCSVSFLRGQNPPVPLCLPPRLGA